MPVYLSSASWPKCGQSTQSTYSKGCEQRQLDHALKYLGFAAPTRINFVDWAVAQAPAALASGSTAP